VELQLESGAPMDEVLTLIREMMDQMKADDIVEDSLNA
jgi:hypothetical protein